MSYLERELQKTATPGELVSMGVDVTRPKRRGIMLRLAKFHTPVKREWDCTCAHTRKHHKSSGRCRGNCSCTAGLAKAAR